MILSDFPLQLQDFEIQVALWHSMCCWLGRPVGLMREPKSCKTPGGGLPLQGLACALLTPTSPGWIDTSVLLEGSSCSRASRLGRTLCVAIASAWTSAARSAVCGRRCTAARRWKSRPAITSDEHAALRSAIETN